MMPAPGNTKAILSIALVLVVKCASSAMAALEHASQAAVEQWKDVGPAAASDLIHFTVHLKSRDEDGLDSKMMEIVESNGRLNWLKFEELKAFVEPAPDVKNQITKIWEDGGAQKVSFGKLGNTLTVTINVGEASKLLQATFNRFTKDGLDKPIVRAYNYTIPAALEPYTIGLTPLLNFQEKSKNNRRSLAARHLSPGTGNVEDSWTNARNVYEEESAELLSRTGGSENPSIVHVCDKVATPACLRKLYGVGDYNGKPDDPSIALVLFGPEGTNKADVDAFMKKYRPGVKYDLQLAFGQGLQNSPPPAGEFAELTLDIQTAAGIASPIPVKGYVLPTSENTDIAFTSFFNYFSELADAQRPGVASYSFGTEELSEATSSLRIGCQAAKHLTALGTTIFVASGDWGVFGTIKGGAPGMTCPPFLPTWPSGCQYVVSVGATAGFSPETAVNFKQNEFWGGGGFSNVFPTPDYQKDVVEAYIKSLNGTEDGNFNVSGRAYPDLSAIGYMVPTIHAGRLGAQLGTSASSPSAAAIFALLNSARKAAGLGTIGWANPTLYKHPDLFVDVTKGKAAGCTDAKGKEHSLPAAPGWDAATGWGSLRFDKLKVAFGVEPA